MRGVLGNLGQERIVQEDGGLVAVTGRSVAKQRGDIYLQGTSETVERGEGRHRLAILDLRDIGAWYPHACGELALRQVADVAEIAHGGSDLGARLGGFRGGLKN